MKQSKTKHTPKPWTQWKIVNNTDSVDINAKCIGLSPRRNSIPNDVWDHIATNRGLHIQIRHNKDPQTYAQANDLAALIAAAPELLSMLEYLFTNIRLEVDAETNDKILKLIKQAGGNI